jgi:large subunit ribosomal protein L4
LVPRDYSYRLPKKAVRSATRMAIASKIDAGDLVVIDELTFTAPKTRDMNSVLRALKLAGTSTLVTTATYDVNVLKSARNIDKVTVAPVADLNALCVLKPRRMLVTKAALDAICRKPAS